MADFPDLNPNSFEHKFNKPVFRAESSSGYQLTRAKATARKSIFSFGFTSLSLSDRDLISDFFDANQGDSFNYTSPEVDATTYTVVFADDALSFIWKEERWMVTINLVEV